MMGVSYRGPRGGVAKAMIHLEAKQRTVQKFIFQKINMLGNGVICPVHKQLTSFVKEVSK